MNNIKINKLQKYSDEPFKITDDISIKHIFVKDVIKNGEEWYFGDILQPFRVTKEFFNFNILSKDEMTQVIKEYDEFRDLELNLTSEIIEGLDTETFKLIIDRRSMIYNMRLSSCTEDELSNMSLLEVYIRLNTVDIVCGTGTGMTILDKSIKALRLLMGLGKEDEILVDDVGMKLIVRYWNIEDGECFDVVIDGDMFETISEVVLLINYTEKAQDESLKKRKYPNEEIRKKMEKLLAERKKIEDLKRQKTEVEISYFEYMLNYVLNSDDEKGNIDLVNNYTIYHLNKRYHAISYKETYKHNIQSMFNCDSKEAFAKLDLVHWMDKIKKDNR